MGWETNRVEARVGGRVHAKGHRGERGEAGEKKRRDERRERESVGILFPTLSRRPVSQASRPAFMRGGRREVGSGGEMLETGMIEI